MQEIGLTPPHVAPVPKQDLVFQRQMSLSSPFCVQIIQWPIGAHAWRLDAIKKKLKLIFWKIFGLIQY
jgi:hypothetical protein